MAVAESTASSNLDTVKLILALTMLILGVVGFYYYAETYILIYRVLGLLGITVIALILAYNTALGKKLFTYFKESRIELQKVVWPTRTETLQTTLIVAIMVVLTGLFLWFVDWFFSWLIQFLLGL